MMLIMKELKKFLSNSVIIFVGTMIASILSYLFNMVMGRLLGPSQYGEMTAIMSLLMITSVGGGAVLTVAMRYSGELYFSSPIEKLKKLFKVFTKYIFFIGLALFVLGVILTKPVSIFFNIDHLFPIILAFTTFIFGFLILVNKGILQGTQKFLSVSVVNAVEMALRLSLGIILVRIGLGLNGAIFSIVIAILISYLITFFPLRRLFQEKSAKQSDSSDFLLDKKEILNYVWPTTITMFLLTIALNVDIIFVKHYFSSENAGVYAAVSTIAKIILYGTAPIISVMFPMISEKKIKGDKHYLLFLTSLLCTVLVAALVLTAYAVMPGKIILLLYGASYTSLFYLLPEVGLFILFYTLVNLMSNYYLAIRDFTFIWFFAFILALQIGVISFWHISILMIVRTLIATTGLLFIMMISYYLLKKKDQILSYFKEEDAG